MIKHIQYHIKDALELLSDLPEKSVDLVVIDPPYGTDPSEFIKKFYSKSVRDNKKRHGKTTKIITSKYDTGTQSPNTLMTGDTYEQYFKKFFEEAHRVLSISGNLAVFQGLDYLGPTYEMIPPKFYFRNIIIYGFWHRRNITSSGLSTAYIPILWVSKSQKPNFYQDAFSIVKYFPNLRTEDHLEKSVPNIWLSKKDYNIKYYSSKPLVVMMALVELLSPPGGIVVDTFAGSGTTGEACILTGRKCIMADLYEDALITAKARLIKYLPDIDKYYKEANVEAQVKSGFEITTGFKEMFKKESSEHPRLPAHIVKQIVMDHIKNGVHSYA